MKRALITLSLAIAAAVLVGCSGEEGSATLPTSSDYAKELEEAKNQDFSKMSEKRAAGERDRIRRLEELVKNPPKEAPKEPVRENSGGNGGGSGGRDSGGGGGGGVMQPPKDGETVQLPVITHKADGTPLDSGKDKGKDKGKDDGKKPK